MGELDSEALTKIQTVVLIAIVLIASVAGGLAYFYLNKSNVSGEVIRIGYCGDLDSLYGAALWQGALLAAEQVNAEGGVLGKNFEIVAEDDDSESLSYDVTIMTNALNRLIAVDKADFILSSFGGGPMFQDICADHRIIFFSIVGEDEMTQRVADNYSRYKGFFRAGGGNVTSINKGTAESILTLRDYTGFNKVAFLTPDLPFATEATSIVSSILLENDFDIVHSATMPPGTIDFSSYYAGVESSGAEILVPSVYEGPCVPFVKEYGVRQSPFVVWGSLSLAQNDDFWDSTGGGCQSVSFTGDPMVSGYPLTSKTLSSREAYIDRWGEVPNQSATRAYDLVRFVLPDAIRRAGTIEYEAIIDALESTDVETSLFPRFVYTSNHDTMIGTADPNKPGEYYNPVCVFQWQDGKQVLVYPKELMEEAGATYKFPDWSGPWD